VTTLAWTRHEWNRLRLLRRVGVVFAAAVPILLLGAAEAASRGWGLGRESRGYDVATVLADASPVVLAGVWALLSALAVGQAIAEGETGATESWIRTLPIPRRRVWTARLVASMTSVTIVVLVSAATLYGMCRAIVGTAARFPTPTQIGWSALGIGLALAGTLVAAALVRPALLAALAGLLLGAIPVAALMATSSWFPMAAWVGRVPSALVLPSALALAMPLAAWRAACVGEPSGRGRVRRAGAVLAVALALGVAGFAVIGWTARTVECRLGRAWRLDPAPSGERVVATVGQGGPGELAGLFDAVRGTRIRVLGGATRAIHAWSPDGTAVASIRDVSPLGRLIAPEIVVHDASDGSVRFRTVLPDTGGGPTLVTRLAWCGDFFVLLPWDGPPILLPAGTPGEAVAADALDTSGADVELLGCAAGGDVLALVADRAALASWRKFGPDGRGEPPVSRIVGLASVGDRVEIDEVASVAMDPFRVQDRLSRDGRFLMIQSRIFGAATLRVFDLVERTERVLEDARFSGWWGWLEDGSLAWADDSGPEFRVRLWRPGEDPREIAVPIERATSMTLEVAPDGRRVLARTSHRIPGPEGESAAWVTESLEVVDPRDGHVVSLIDSAPGSGGRAPRLGFWTSSDAVLIRTVGEADRIVRVPLR